MKRLNLILLILGMATGVWAERVDLSTARRVAEQVTIQSALRSVGNSTLKLAYEAPALSDNGLRSATGETDYYVFNVGDGDGFVIVSGEDRAHPVLGYSTSGRFVADSLPSNAAAWLEGYQREIAHLVKMKAEAPASVREEWENYLAGSVRTDGGLLLKTANWSQEAPYNWQTPEVDGQHTLTCCMATAAAIILKYHKGPYNPTKTDKETVMLQVGTNLAEARQSTPRPYTVDYSGTYDWGNMLDRYDSPYTKTQGDAVAKLMWHIGASANVIYGLDVSTTPTFPIERVLREVFGCSTTRLADKMFYSWEKWKELMRTEIDDGRPSFIFAANSTASVGHGFVCDGYDAVGLFHINWGWSGEMNGYFQASTLDPYGGDVSNQYNAYQLMIIGIDPRNQATVEAGYEPAGCVKMEEGGIKAPVVGTPYQVPVVIVNRGLEKMSGTFGLALFDSNTESLTTKPTYTIQETIDARSDTCYGEKEINLSITLSEQMTDTEIIMPCYLKDDHWEPITLSYEDPCGIDGNGVYVRLTDKPNDPEATYYPFFSLNEFDKKYLSKDTSELPITIALRQVEGQWPTATIRYRLREDALTLMQKGWELHGRLGPNGEYRRFQLTDSVEFVVTPADYISSDELYNIGSCLQYFKLIWPEEKGPKATGTFSYEVAIFDENGQRLDDPGALVGKVEMIEKPLSWNMTLSNVKEDPETERVISYDAIFTLLQADKALMDDKETELFTYFTLGQGDSATVTDEEGNIHALIDEGNGRYRLDDWSVRLAEEVSPLTLHADTLHVELTSLEAGKVIFPSLEMARHDDKLISVNTFAIDISYSDFKEHYYPVIDPADSLPRTDCDAELSLYSLVPIKDVLFRLVPKDPEQWLTGDQLVSLATDGQEISLEWDEATQSFTVDEYRMNYDELGGVEYTLPFRLKATQEGHYGFTLEVWNTHENVCKCFDYQEEILVTCPVKVEQLKTPEGYVGSTDTLAFCIKSSGICWKEGSPFTLTLQLNGNLPDKSVTLFNGTDSIPFTTCGEQAIEANPGGTLETDSVVCEYRIRSSVPVDGGVHNPFVVQIFDKVGRMIPVNEDKLNISFYEDYKFVMDLEHISISSTSKPEIAATQDTFQIRSGQSIYLEMKAEEGYRLPSVPLLYEDTTLVSRFESGSNYEYSIDTISIEDAEIISSLWIQNPKADYRLVMKAVNEEKQCEVVSDDPTIMIPEPILNKGNGFQTFTIQAAEGYELPPYVEVTAWRLKPLSALRSATTLAENDQWEEIEMVYMRDYTYDPETGEVQVRVKNVDKIVITASDTKPETPEDPDPDPEEPVYYTVSLPQIEGATTEPDFGTHEVMAGDSFTFWIILDEDYNESNPIVRVDGDLLEPDAKGEYVIETVRANTVITIEGIVKNDDTAIGSIDEMDAVRVWTATGSLHVQLPRPMPVRVVNYAGQVIRSWQAVEGDQAVSLPDGAYIVIAGDRHFKVVL